MVDYAAFILSRVDAFTASGDQIDTAHHISRLKTGNWLVVFVDCPRAATAAYCIAYAEDGAVERVQLQRPLDIPKGESFEIQISPPVAARTDPTDLLERLKGNGRPWTFAEIIEEISRLRRMRMDVLHYANCLKAAHVAGPPEYDFDDEKEFVECILKTVL